MHVLRRDQGAALIPQHRRRQILTFRDGLGARDFKLNDPASPGEINAIVVYAGIAAIAARAWLRITSNPPAPGIEPVLPQSGTWAYHLQRPPVTRCRVKLVHPGSAFRQAPDV
jgi:hypothetical protein